MTAHSTPASTLSPRGRGQGEGTRTVTVWHDRVPVRVHLRPTYADRTIVGGVLQVQMIGSFPAQRSRHDTGRLQRDPDQRESRVTRQERTCRIPQERAPSRLLRFVGGLGVGGKYSTPRRTSCSFTT